MVYLLSLAPDLTSAHFGGDGGELIAASHTLGIPHPPGYPTYVILGKLFSLLPFGTIAARYNLFSATATAVAAGFVSWTAVQLSTPAEDTGRRKLSIAACIGSGLSMALAPMVWSQSVIAEVYALNLAFLAIFLWLLLTDRSPFGIGFFLGLSITAHLTSTLMLPLAMTLVPRKSWTRLIIGLALGLLPFVILPILSKSGSPVIWGEPDSFRGWLWLVSAQLYRPNVLALPPNQWPQRLVLWGPFTLAQLALLVAPTVIFLQRERSKLLRRRAFGLLITSAVVGIYALTYATHDSIVFLLPVILLLSMAAALFLTRLGWVALAIPAFMVILAARSGLAEPIPTIRIQMERILIDAPAESILLTPGDETIAALWYFHHVEARRPDVAIVDSNMFQFSWYRERLSISYPDLTHLEKDDMEGFISSNAARRPVCRVSLVAPGLYTCWPKTET
jgi:hypothetical protein